MSIRCPSHQYVPAQERYVLLLLHFLPQLYPDTQPTSQPDVDNRLSGMLSILRRSLAQVGGC